MQITNQPLSELSVKGLTIYNDRLKALLEPEHNNEWVAIHVDTSDYATGKT
jgi:hypothetical protein